MILHRGWKYFVTNWRMYLHRIRFKLKFYTITFYRLGNVKDRLPVSPKLTPSWLLTANGQFVKDEARRSSFLLSQLWNAKFVLTWKFLWKNLQEQVLCPSLLCWRYTENFWSVESETHSVWLTTWLRMTTSPLKMLRLLSSFQLKQIRYSFYFTSQCKLFVILNYHWVLWAYLAIEHLVSFLIFVILEFPHPILLDKCLQHISFQHGWHCL